MRGSIICEMIVNNLDKIETMSQTYVVDRDASTYFILVAGDSRTVVHSSRNGNVPVSSGPMDHWFLIQT